MTEELNKTIQNRINDGHKTLVQKELKDLVVTEVAEEFDTLLTTKTKQWLNKGYTITPTVQGEMRHEMGEDALIKRAVQHYLKTQDMNQFKETVTPIVDGYFNHYIGEGVTFNHPNPHDRPFNELTQVLIEGVVRIKDVYGHEWYGTRHPGLLKIYAQKNYLPKKNDVLTFYDLKTGVTQELERDEIAHEDTELNIASWIEFEEDNDAWYVCAFQKENVRNYYQEGEVKALMAGKNDQRTKYERQLVKGNPHTKSQIAVLWERENLKAFQQGERQVAEILHYKEPVENQEPLIEEIEEWANNIKHTIDNLKGNPYDIVVKMYTPTHTGKTIGKRADIYMNQQLIRVTPYYIVNAHTGKVYLDRFNVFKTSLLRMPEDEFNKLTQPDVIIGPYIRQFIDHYQINKPLHLKEINTTKTEEDKIRLNTLNHWANNNHTPKVKDTLKQLGVEVLPVDGRDVYRVIITATEQTFNVGYNLIEWQHPKTHRPEVLVWTNDAQNRDTDVQDAIGRAKQQFRVDDSVVYSLDRLLKLWQTLTE